MPACRRLPSPSLVHGVLPLEGYHLLNCDAGSLPVGAGDAYSAGFLYGYLTGDGDLARAIAYGDALAALKHTVPGDFPVFTLAEVEAHLAGRGTGLIR